jgi:hypothetical protein
MKTESAFFRRLESALRQGQNLTVVSLGKAGFEAAMQYRNAPWQSAAFVIRPTAREAIVEARKRRAVLDSQPEMVKSLEIGDPGPPTGP